MTYGDQADVCPCGGRYVHKFERGWHCEKCDQPRVFRPDADDATFRDGLRDLRASRRTRD